MLGVLLALFAQTLVRPRRAQAAAAPALADALTGVPNRAALLEALTAAVEDARRGGHAAALYAVGLDRFTERNGALGHPAGDAVLAEAAQRLRRASRRGETVGRTSGDGFAAVVPRVEPDADLMEPGYRLLAALSGAVVVDGAAEPLRASVGIARFPHDGMTPADLLAAAEAAMLCAKRAGGGTVVAYGDGMRADLDRRRLRRDAASPNLERQLIACYQPLFASETGTVVGAEGFVRWLHPHDGLLPASTVVNAASSAGAAAGAIDAAMLRATLQQARRWHESAPLPLYVNAGVPDAALLDACERAMASARPGALELRIELTEAAAMRLTDETAAFARECRRRGMQFGLDNFGSSPVDLRALERIAPDFLKLDVGVLTGGEAPAGGRGAAAAATAIAGALGIATIAQGVTHPAQMPWLVERGVRTMQGYYLAPPMTAVDFAAWLEARAARQAGSPELRAEA